MQCECVAHSNFPRVRRPHRTHHMAAPIDEHILRECVKRGDVEGTANVLPRLGHSPATIAGLSSALSTAAYAPFETNAKIVRILVADGRANPRVDFSFPLRAAAHYRQHDLVQLLLDDGRADPVALNGAFRREYVWDVEYEAIVRLLIADGRADVCGARACHPIYLPMITVALRWQRRRTWLRAVV
jgi:hypothetical protein